MDYDLETQAILRALKEGQQLSDSNLMPVQSMGGYVAPYHPGAGIANALNQATGAMMTNRAEQRQRDLSAQEQGELSQLQSEMLNVPQDMDYTKPEALIGENRRQMEIATRMSRLPSARKMAETMWTKGIGAPDKIAELQMRQIEAGNQNAMRLEESARRERERLAAEAERQRERLEAAKDRAAMIAATKGAGGGARDRYSVQTGPDNQMYRVNLETGQATPITIASALPGAVAAQTPGVGLQKPKAPPTEAERTAAGYLGRMEAAEAELNKIRGGEATEATAAAGAVPIVGPYVQRKLETEAQSKYRQYADDWIRAKLRKESGAVIGKEEMDKEYQTYFPQPGEKPAVILQKAQARKQAMEQLRTSAGQVVPIRAPSVGGFSDAEKEKRYQEWKARQGK